MKNRTADYYRHQRTRTIKRKYNIRRKLWGSKEAEDFYSHVPKGTLSKGKIHCSCWMCRTKSHDELKFRDKREVLRMNSIIKEYLS